jgi:hypothetical protein
MSTSANAPDAPDEESEYEADFTSEQASAMVTCKRCSRVFPSGTKLRLMQSKRHGSDRFFCSECYEHYRSKETTTRRTPGTGTQAPSKVEVFHKRPTSRAVTFP